MKYILGWRGDIIISIISMTIGFIVGTLWIASVINDEIVDHGCAYYDTQTSKFTWNEENKL